VRTLEPVWKAQSTIAPKPHNKTNTVDSLVTQCSHLALVESPKRRYPSNSTPLVRSKRGTGYAVAYLSPLPPLNPGLIWDGRSYSKGRNLNVRYMVMCGTGPEFVDACLYSIYFRRVASSFLIPPDEVFKTSPLFWIHVSTLFQ
jgi:hypothetical protein